MWPRAKLKKSDLERAQLQSKKKQKEKTMKKIYIATLRPTEEQEVPEGLPQGLIPEQKVEKVVLADNISEVEAVVPDGFIMDRVVMIEQWILAEEVEDKKGDFYMADTVYFDEVKQEEDSMQFFVRAETFTEIEDIVSDECGETFRYIKAVEKAPYEVLGV